MFTLGVSLVVSALAVYFEDVQHMYQVVTIGLMYMTPIIYPIGIIPFKWLWVIRANPLTHLVKLARDPVYGCTLPGAARDPRFLGGRGHRPGPRLGGLPPPRPRLLPARVMMV